jgi:hypothetical protein
MVLCDEKRVRSQMSDCGRVAGGAHDEAIGVQYARVCTYAFTARCWISDACEMCDGVSALPPLSLYSTSVVA